MRITVHGGGGVLPSTIVLSATGAQMIGPAFAADPFGTWYTEARTARSASANCGGALCGALVWLKEPNDPATGRPKTDKNNADASKQQAGRCSACRSCSA